MTWHPWDALAQPSTLPDFKPVRLEPLCLCKVDPYTCPKGLALVEGIIAKKTNQGDQ